MFPTKVSSLDAFGFAYLINESRELFLAHHLLYNLIGFLWIKLFHLFSDLDSLYLLKIMNAVAASISLMLLERILRIRGFEPVKRILWVVFAGSSWAVMRFATENETYILPICFSLIGSYFFTLYLSKSKLKVLLLAGFFAAFAALIHQIHFFWWLGLLLSLLIMKRSFKKVLIFTLPSLIVPLVYIFVLIHTKDAPISSSDFFQFVFNDYQSGVAEFSIDSKNFLLTPISFIRTFVQVHGYMYNYLKENLWLIFSLLASLVLFGKFLVSLKSVRFDFRKITSCFVSGHLLAFLLQLIFAFISHGNAEFMVMLPFLFSIVFSEFSRNEIRPLYYLVSGLLIWNLSFGIVPLAKDCADGDEMVAEFLMEDRQDRGDNSLFVIFNLHRVANMVGYYESHYSLKNLKSIEEFESKKEVISEIKKALKSDKIIYTDCIDRPATISRASLLINNYQGAFEGFQKEKVDSSLTLSGKYYLYKITNAEDKVLK
jgi:hypothetical protein